MHIGIEYTTYPGKGGWGRDIETPLWLPSEMASPHMYKLSIIFLLCLVSILSAPKAGHDPRDHYLGLLYPSEQYKV